jgi:hypothetical protein
MTEILHQRIEKWIANNLKLVSIYNPVSIHIDDLLGGDVKKSETISTSILAFLTLVKRMQELEMPAKPMLVILLINIGKKIKRAIPHNLVAIESQLDIEPPSLYLLDWSPAEYFETCEEYRSPLTFKLINNSIDGIYIYYREFRYAMGIENNWEFSRGIYVGYLL